MDNDNKTNTTIFGKGMPQIIHDVRNSLNVIIGFSSFLHLDESLTDEVKGYIQNMYNAGMNIEQILLDIDNYIADDIEKNEENLDLSSFVSEFLRQKEKMLNEKSIIYKTEIQEGLSIKFSQMIMTRILENLLIFSMKGLRSIKEKKIINLHILKNKDNLLIVYFDSSMPVFIKNDFFTVDELLASRRGLALEFVRKYISKYDGKIKYFYGKKLQGVLTQYNINEENSHGIIIKLPII